MKRDICECGGCRKTATVRIGGGHRICEDCAKWLRRLKNAGRKPRCIFKEVLVGHLGKFDIYVDIPIRIRR